MGAKSMQSLFSTQYSRACQEASKPEQGCGSSGLPTTLLFPKYAIKQQLNFMSARQREFVLKGFWKQRGLCYDPDAARQGALLCVLFGHGSLLHAVFRLWTVSCSLGRMPQAL